MAKHARIRRCRSHDPMGRTLRLWLSMGGRGVEWWAALMYGAHAKRSRRKEGR